MSRIEPLEIEKEMRKSYLDYAMSVIVGRALPDVRDGLKPVHRRVLFAMKQEGNDWNRAYKKSARTVGNVIGKYHPHGDSAVYDTLVRMAQPFSLRHVLVDGQGNFGSIDGDSPAAMRYTEARLSRLASELMSDLDQDTVDFGPNYDGSEEEPLVLPTRFPNLLVNGAQGIAVGMATSIPPHNLKECCAALMALIDHPELGLPQLMTYIQGPDFPGGGIMLGTEGVVDAYRTGRGRCVVRAKSHTETIRVKNKGEVETIVFTELPYQVNKATTIEKIAELVRDKKLDGIADIRDESDREGIRLVIELKKGEPSEIVLNQLYQQTQLQNSFPITMLTIVNGQPRILTLKEVLQEFIGFRREVVTRRTLFQLRKAEERHHILLGLKIALDWLDEVIKLIRAAKNPEEAKAGLMDGRFAGKQSEKFKLSERQAQAILDMRLQRLTGLERDKILEELAEVEKTIKRLKAILEDEQLLLSVIKEELQAVSDQFGNARRTEITGYSGEIRMEDVVPDDPMVVTLSKTGYIKRTDLMVYRRQKRGGKGKVGMKTKDDDFVEQLFLTKAHDTLMVFTDRGYVYALKVYDIPESGAANRGKHIKNLVSLKDGENPVTLMALREFPEGEYLIFATSDGTVKKTSLAAYANIRSNGLIALNIGEENGNRLVAVRRSSGGQQLLLATAQGKAIRFSEEDVRPMGRPATGVRGMKLATGDHIVDMEVADPLPDLPEGVEADESTAVHGMVLTVTEKGFGKRSLLQDYRLQGRGGSGVINIRAGVRNGQVVGFKLVRPEEGCLLISQEGMTIRFDADSVRKTGRNALGVQLFKLDAPDKVVGLAKIDAAAHALDEEDDLLESGTPGPDESGEQGKLEI
jgi:DNA gyrase subunit A